MIDGTRQRLHDLFHAADALDALLEKHGDQLPATAVARALVAADDPAQGPHPPRRLQESKGGCG